jgi:hypothetical protein
MTDEVRKSVNRRGGGMPVQPVFSDQRGNIIGDGNANYNNNGQIEHNHPDDELPGVMLPEIEEIPGVPAIKESVKILGVDTGQDPHPEPIVDTGIALENIASTPVDKFPLVEDEGPTTTPTIVNPNKEHVHALWRSSRQRVQWKPDYEPSMHGKPHSRSVGKRYAFAVTQLGAKLLDNAGESSMPELVYCFMEQLLLNTAIKKWGSVAEGAGMKEAAQLHWRNTFKPKIMSELSKEQKQRLLPSHMSVLLKRSGEARARLAAGANVQRDFISKEETSSPTAATEAVLLTSIVNASENRDVAIVDIPNAFIQTWVQKEKDRVILHISGKVVEWLVAIAPEVYKGYVVLGKRDIPHLLVECHNTIYRMMVAGLLYY